MLIGPIIAIVVAVIAIGVGMFFLLRSIPGKDKSEQDRYYYDEDDDDDRFMSELKSKTRGRDKEYYRDDEFDRRR